MTSEVKLEPTAEDVRRVAAAMHADLSKQDIMAYLSVDFDLDRLALAAILAMDRRAEAVPVAWMNADHIRAYQDGTGEGIAWASPEPTDFYSVPLALAAAPQPPARGVVDGSVLVPKAFLEFVKNAPVSSGVCCCGDNMDGHADPMSCGHTPRDQWEYSLSQWLEEIASPPAPAVADDPANDAAFRVLRDAGDKLSLAAQTTGGTAGRDDGLVAAIDGWTAARNKALQLRRIARYEPAPAVAVPEGWKLVPVEPTEEMWGAYFEAVDLHFPTQRDEARAAGRGWKGMPAVVWETMLAAAPQPPATRSYEEGRDDGIEAAAMWLTDEIERLKHWVSENIATDACSNDAVNKANASCHNGMHRYRVARAAIRSLKGPRDE